MDRLAKEIAHINSLIQRGHLHLNEYDAIKHEKSLLTEMAFGRKDFIIQVVFMLPQIIQNWCLCHYASKYGLDEGLREHWGGELQTHLLNIAANKLKGNNSVENRIKAYAAAWENKEVNSDPNVIDMIISAKFKKENISTETEQYQETIQSCIAETQNIIKLLSDGIKENIQNYALTV